MNQTISPVAANDVVSASVNERKFFESLGHIFAGRYSVIGELMQNARRAGASVVRFEIDPDKKSVSVADDGHGIQDFQALLSLCESGWDESVKLTDKPFGMGVFSLFFAAKKVHFSSGGKRLTVCVDDVINKRPLRVEPEAEPQSPSGTLIVLEEACKEFFDMHYGDLKIRSEIRDRAMGFPIRVLINWEEVDRPHAQANLVGQMTPIGFVSYKGVTHAAGGQMANTDRRCVYLQGLPIEEPVVSQSAEIIVHLDSESSIARMPDRSALINPKDEKQRVDAALRQMATEYLASRKSSMPSDEFVKTHWSNCRALGLMQLMSDVDVVPNCAVTSVERVCSYADDVWRFGIEGQPAILNRTFFEKGSVPVWKGLPTQVEEGSMDPLVLKVAKQLGAVEPPSEIKADHWLNQMAVSLDDLRFTWEVDGVAGSAHYSGNKGTCETKKAKSIKVKVSKAQDPTYLFETEFTHGWVMVPADSNGLVAWKDGQDKSMELDLICYYINASDDDSPVDVFSDFSDESDVFRDEWREEAMVTWKQSISDLNSDPLDLMLKELIARSETGVAERHSGQVCLVGALPQAYGAAPGKVPPLVVEDLMDESLWETALKDSGLSAALQGMDNPGQKLRDALIHAMFKEAIPY